MVYSSRSQQDIVFESLANSACNPSDFLCICKELQALDVAGKVAAGCSAAESAQYNAFRSTICSNGPFTTTSVIVTPTPAPVNATSGTPAVYTPASNGTLSNTTTLLPVIPAGATTAPPAAQYTGGVETVRIGVLAGAIGIMGFVFAEL